jgi:UDP-N-acetylmuramate dehydrogenase
MNAAADDVASSSAALRNESMAKHTTWRVGGPADIYFKPATVDELAAFLAALSPDVPVHWTGLGSNLLVRDGGIRGAVIATAGLAKLLERRGELGVRAGAGLPCMLLARQCVRWQLGPAAFFAGIPGTVGGALAMNAGAFGGETWRHVEHVETIDRSGARHTRPRAEFTIGYRSVRGPAGEWFVAAELAFERDSVTDMATLRGMLARRAETQPLGLPSCGSVFRNPPGAYAGELIERAGLKGARVGGAVVSDKHANFIVNSGAATAADIEALIDKVRAEVEHRSGIRLEAEVRVVGERLHGGGA